MQCLADRKYYSLYEDLKICGYKPKILIDKRDRAAVAKLFLSAMRITAFVSLPVRCVDIENMTVYQDPNEGVITKNSKTSITILLPIDPLVMIMRAWDKLL